MLLQVGAGEYRPQRLIPADAPGRAGVAAGGLRVSWFEFTPSLAELMAGADLVVSHAGSGSVFEALAAGKALVAVPNAALMANHQARPAAASCLLSVLQGQRQCDMGAGSCHFLVNMQCRCYLTVPPPGRQSCRASRRA